MYNFSAANNEIFQQKIHSSVREPSGYVELYDTDKTLIKTYNASGLLKSLEIQRVGNNNFFGSVISQKLTVKLLETNDDLHSGLYLQPYLGFYELGLNVKYPKFKINEINKDEKTGEITIIGYDYLYEADNYTIGTVIDALNEEIEAGTRRVYNLRDILGKAAQLIGCDEVSGVYYKSINQAQNILAGTATYSGAIASGFNNTTKLINLDGTETIRDFLKWCAELFQGVIYIQCNGLLAIKRILPGNATDETITGEDYSSLDTKTNRKLVGLCKTTELGNNIEAKLEQSGTIFYFRNNPFLETVSDTDVANFLNQRLTEVQLLTITQFNCDWFSNPRLEYGDKIELVDRDGNNTYTSFLLNDVITYNGGLKEKTEWNYNEEEASEATPSTIGDVIKSTYAKVDKANKEITLVASDVRVVDGKATVAQTMATNAKTTADNAQGAADSAQASANEAQSSADSAQASADEAQSSADNAQSVADAAATAANEAASSAEEAKNGIADTNNTIQTIQTDITEIKQTAENITISVKKIVDDGVSKIETGMGYSFDDDGLNVSRTDSELSTTINEDGMKVKKNDEEMLVANNQGVDAVNLHAKTYLIIGQNSRFEDYEKDGTQYTACFWIGG